MICGIDPGYDRLGIAFLSGTVSAPIHEHSECFTPLATPKSRAKSRDENFFDQLLLCGERIAVLLDEYTPSAIALETLFITKNQKTAMRVAELRGVILYEARKRNIPIFEYSPPQIKLAVTGYGASDKKAVGTMIDHFIHLPKRKIIDDEYDALAVAITHMAHAKNPK